MTWNKYPPGVAGDAPGGGTDHGRLRELGVLSNFSISFSVISVLTWVTTLYNTGLAFGGPATMTLGWFVAGAFTMAVGLSMAEICSAFPTSGGLYYWSARLSGDRWAPFASWITGWFNIVGQWAGTASIDFSLAQLIQVIVLLSTGGNNGGGYLASKYVVFAFHTEETKNADRNGPIGIISAIGISLVVGWGYILGITFAVKDIPYLLSADNDAGGYAIAEVFYLTFKSPFNLGRYSVLVGWIAVLWVATITVLFSLPVSYPVTKDTLNYTPVAVGGLFTLILLSWIISARHRFKGPVTNLGG
nr:unnamed protein product [Digitaria exilis]